jgi:hypothetical protein
MNFLEPLQRASSRGVARRPRCAGLEVAQLEGRALLSGVPSVATGVALAWEKGMVDVHVTGSVSDPGAFLTPTLTFRLVSSTGRLVASGGATLSISGSHGTYDFSLGLTPSQLSSAGGQTYEIYVRASDTYGHIGLGTSMVPPAAPPPGVIFPMAVAPPSRPSTPSGPLGYVVNNTTPTFTLTTAPLQSTHAPGYVDYNNGVAFN